MGSSVLLHYWWHAVVLLLLLWEIMRKEEIWRMADWPFAKRITSFLVCFLHIICIICTSCIDMEADRKFICFFPCYTKKKVSRALTWNLVVLTVGKLQSAAMSKQYWPWYPPSLGSFLQTNKESSRLRLPFLELPQASNAPPSQAPNFISVS